YLFPDERPENHDRPESKTDHDTFGCQNRDSSINHKLGEVHHDCGQRLSADETALHQSIRQEKGDHDRSYATEECRKETEYRAQDSKSTEGNAQRIGFADVAIQDRQDQE